MDWVGEMFTWLSHTALWLAGAVGIAFTAFRFLGSKWIETKFAARLEAYRHEQTKELEELRHKINAAFSRMTKIHEKEFEALPEAWYKLQDALGHISGLTSVVQCYPDLNRMMRRNWLNSSSNRTCTTSRKRSFARQMTRTPTIKKGDSGTI